MSLEAAFARIFERAYDVTVLVGPNNSEPIVQKTVKDADLDILYEALKRASFALDVARETFTEYAAHHRAKLDTLLTLVERIDVEKKVARNETLAHMMRSVLLGRHQGVAGEKVWFPIDGAPQKGAIRLLGRLDDGRPYVETGSWTGTRWSIEDQESIKPPTHWAPIEGLPTEYQR